MSDTKHTPELKPCPMCGSDKIRMHIDCYIQCDHCGIQTAWHESELAAAIVWNTRAGMADPEKEIAALRADAAEKAREALDLIYDMADDWREHYEEMYGEYRKEIQTRNSWKLDVAKSALAALEGVLK